MRIDQSGMVPQAVILMDQFCQMDELAHHMLRCEIAYIKILVEYVNDGTYVQKSLNPVQVRILP